MNRITTVVVRESRDEAVFAIVACDESWSVKTPTDIRHKIRHAVTEWMKTSPEGRQAWKDASEDFNVGDLSNHLADRDLQRCLSQRGVENLTIDVHSSSNRPDPYWTYDLVLPDAWVLEQSQEETP
jgi:hypothetical protein